MLYGSFQKSAQYRTQNRRSLVIRTPRKNYLNSHIVLISALNQPHITPKSLQRSTKPPFKAQSMGSIMLCYIISYHIVLCYVMFYSILFCSILFYSTSLTGKCFGASVGGSKLRVTTLSRLLLRGNRARCSRGRGVKAAQIRLSRDYLLAIAAYWAILGRLGSSCPGSNGLYEEGLWQCLGLAERQLSVTGRS